MKDIQISCAMERDLYRDEIYTFGAVWAEIGTFHPKCMQTAFCCRLKKEEFELKGCVLFSLDRTPIEVRLIKSKTDDDKMSSSSSRYPNFYVLIWRLQQCSINGRRQDFTMLLSKPNFASRWAFLNDYYTTLNGSLRVQSMQQFLSLVDWSRNKFKQWQTSFWDSFWRYVLFFYLRL